MKSSCPAIKGLALAIAMLANINVSAQSDPGVVVAPRDYSFTISTAQPWTDTGVDLETGELLGITASPHSSDGCDPRGVSGSGDASAGLPVVSAFPGALIARTQAQGVPILIGSSSWRDNSVRGRALQVLPPPRRRVTRTPQPLLPRRRRRHRRRRHSACPPPLWIQACEKISTNSPAASTTSSTIRATW